MKSHIKYLVAVLAAMLLPLAVKAQEYSADLVTYDQSGKAIRGKVYRGTAMLRTDSAAFPPNSTGSPAILIVDIPKQVSYTIFPDRKSIMVTHGRAALNRASIALPVSEDPCTPLDGSPSPANGSCKKLGEEIVNGRHTVKWEVSETMRGRSSTQILWVDAQLHCIVKMQFGPSLIGELQNIQEGPQPASLFVLPAGYQVMDVGGR